MKKSFPLYIHIPFCRSKCSYCDFFSIPSAGSKAVPDSYISALKTELAYRCGVYKPESWKTVYIGGGTPSLLLPEQLRDIFAFVREAVPGGIDENAEVTIEANPADIKREFLDCIADVGVNRLSVGIQSCSERVLKFVGRRADAEMVSDALDCIRKYWIDDVARDMCGRGTIGDRGAGVLHGVGGCGKKRRFSADLIAGLPFLSDTDFLEGVEKVISSGADHVSLYSLMVEEGTPLWKQVRSGYAPCTDEDAERQWFLGKKRLEEAGIFQYEVSNFACPGFESRHNTAYWHMEDFIGIGAGASGTVGRERWTGVPSIAEYTAGWAAIDSEAVCGVSGDSSSMPHQAAQCSASAQNATIPEETERLDEMTREYEFLMMGFRLRSGVSAAEYRRRFGRELAARLGAESGLFAEWEKRGRAVRREESGDTFYALTADGLMLLNRFLTEL